MPGQRRDELRKRHVLSICQALEAFVLDGGRLGVEVRHGADPADNELRLRIEDWDHFVRVLERPEEPTEPRTDS